MSTCICSGAPSGDGPPHQWQEMYKEDREIRLMEHALGRVRQDALHRQRVRGTHLPFDELHNRREASIRGSRLKSDRFLTHLAQLFLSRGRLEAGGEQEMMSCLKKRIKINISVFTV